MAETEAPGQETITVPRPAPDEVLLAAVDEAGAICWVKVPKAVATDRELLGMMVPLLEEGQQTLHEQARPA